MTEQNIRPWQLLTISCAVILAAVFFSACGPLFPAAKSEKPYYVIYDQGQRSAIPAEKTDLHLLVRNSEANPFLDSRKIVFSREPQTRGFYQLANWVEPPPQRFTFLLTERLSKAGVFASVSRLTNSTLGDLQINTEIRDFYHDISSSPGEVIVRINAELIDLKNRRVIAAQRFSQIIAAKTYNAEGAVEAFSLAVTRILDETMLWTEEVVSDLSAERVEE